jgi:hypothetical protein
MENIYIFALVCYLVIINPFIKLSISTSRIYLILRIKEYIIDDQGYKERIIIKTLTLIKF